MENKANMAKKLANPSSWSGTASSFKEYSSGAFNKAKENAKGSFRQWG